MDRQKPATRSPDGSALAPGRPARPPSLPREPGADVFDLDELWTNCGRGESPANTPSWLTWMTYFRNSNMYKIIK